jgi:hypothetical protein
LLLLITAHPTFSQEGERAELFFISPFFFLDGPPLTMPEESDEFIVVTGVVAGKVFFFFRILTYGKGKKSNPALDFFLSVGVL